MDEQANVGDEGAHDKGKAWAKDEATINQVLRVQPLLESGYLDKIERGSIGSIMGIVQQILGDDSTEIAQLEFIEHNLLDEDKKLIPDKVDVEQFDIAKIRDFFEGALFALEDSTRSLVTQLDRQEQLSKN